LAEQGALIELQQAYIARLEKQSDEFKKELGKVRLWADLLSDQALMQKQVG
jgi:hypothetical protein